MEVSTLKLIIVNILSKNKTKMLIMSPACSYHGINMVQDVNKRLSLLAPSVSCIFIKYCLLLNTYFHPF